MNVLNQKFSSWYYALKQLGPKNSGNKLYNQLHVSIQQLVLTCKSKQCTEETRKTSRFQSERLFVRNTVSKYIERETFAPLDRLYDRKTVPSPCEGGLKLVKNNFLV